MKAGSEKRQTYRRYSYETKGETGGSGIPEVEDNEKSDSLKDFLKNLGKSPKDWKKSWKNGRLL
jgi:hypothetical protein